jgi:hypothetical protein
MNYALPDDVYLQRLEHQTVVGQDFMDAAFRYWLEDNDDRRSPFPEHMRDELRRRTFRLIMEWTFQLDDPEIPGSGEMSAKFEEIIEAVGLALARTDEERLVIQYPGLPRVGDTVNLPAPGSGARTGEIVQRSLVEDMGKKQMRVLVRLSGTGEEWATGFDLTA